MGRFRELLREPALLLDAVETLVVLLVAFGLSLSGDQQNYIVAAVVALVGVAKGFTTTPFPVSVIPDFGRAVLVLAASFGLPMTADQIAVLATFLGTVTTLVMRAQITPTRDPVTKPGGAGAGPVTGEAGYAMLSVVGIVLVGAGLLLLVLDLAEAVAVPILVPILLVVLGVVIVAVDRRP